MHYFAVYLVIARTTPCTKKHLPMVQKLQVYGFMIHVLVNRPPMLSSCLNVYFSIVQQDNGRNCVINFSSSFFCNWGGGGGGVRRGVVLVCCLRTSS